MQKTEPKGAGIDHFKKFLKELGAIQGILVSGTLLAPFFAEKLSSLAPPGFDSMKSVLLVFQLIIVIIGFQVFKERTKKECMAVSVFSLSCAFFLVIGYINALEGLTIMEPITNNRIVKGTACTIDALQIIPKECRSGEYTSDSLEKFAGQYDQLWQNYQTRVLDTQRKLVFTWLAIFALLSLGVSIFVLSQKAVQ